MELLVRFLLITVKFVSLLLLPSRYLLRLFNTNKRKLPAIDNRILNYNLHELRQRLQQRQITSVALVIAYIKRIKIVNKQLNAVVEDRFAAALHEAKKADSLIRAAGDIQTLFRKRPLLGLPFTVKESCALAGMPFAVGSLARSKQRTPKDGTVVKRLRNAGAIPLLVSATPEFCYSIDTDTLLNGRCLNPYDLNCTPGGSSGGEGALNTAGASLFGVGSDIAGSIRIPSLFCGIFGHKPTGGVVTSAGHFPNSPEEEFQKFMVMGPMTRFATDLSPLLEIMAGENANQLRLHEPVELKDLKVHYALGFGGLNGLMHLSVEKDIQDAILNAVDHLQKQGLHVEVAKLSEFKNSMELALSGIARLREMQYALLGGLRAYDTCMEILRLFCRKSNCTTNAVIFDLMRRTNSFMPLRCLRIYKKETKALADKLTEFLGDDGVLLFPTMHATAPQHGWTTLHLWGVDYTLLFNVLGFPVTHVPMGLNDYGLPTGFSVIAAPFQDRLCLRVAVELERAFGGWLPPTQN